MAIPNPNPNIADGVKSDITTYSSNKIESLISTATELPIPTAGDAGKVLTVNTAENGYELDPIPSQVPTIAAGDAGKVISVNSDSNGYELHTLIDPTTILNTGYNSSFNTVSVPASTETTLSSITATEDSIYLVTVYAVFGGSTADKTVYISLKNDSTVYGLTANNTDAGWSHITITALADLDSGESLDINAYHDYAAATKVDVRIQAIKLV